MSARSGFSEQQLEAIERGGDAANIPMLVQTVREQQHDLDSLRLSLDVARRDREELRVALIRAQEEIRRLREEAAEGG